MTNIRFDVVPFLSSSIVSIGGPVKLIVYDLKGCEVKIPIDWYVGKFPNEVCFCSLYTDVYLKTNKMTNIK